jgi:hypothetical protein
MIYTFLTVIAALSGLTGLTGRLIGGRRGWPW